MKKITWKMVKENLRDGLYLSYDDYDRRVMRCNNGWIQARTPRQAMRFLTGLIGQTKARFGGPANQWSRYHAYRVP